MMLEFLAGLTISVIVSEDPAEPIFAVESAPRDAELTLHLLDPETQTPGTPMFVRTWWTEDTLSLEPRFALSRGSSYQVQLKAASSDGLTKVYTVPGAEAAPPELLQVYPKTQQIPANLLKFYLQFSAPMREGGEIFDQIHLESEDGKRVHDPWRRQELWDESSQRLTLWIHPGRVKQGVNLRETLGPVLLPNQTYTLVIDGSIRSAAGSSLGESVRIPFQTTTEDYTRVLPQHWELDVPTAASSDPLRIRSPKPLDHALLQRHLHLYPGYEGDQEMPCEIVVGVDQTSWEVRPRKNWKAEPYELRISPYLEDLAGNTPLRVFDTDLQAAPGEPGHLVLLFRPDASE